MIRSIFHISPWLIYDQLKTAANCRSNIISAENWVSCSTECFTDSNSSKIKFIDWGGGGGGGEVKCVTRLVGGAWSHAHLLLKAPRAGLRVSFDSVCQTDTAAVNRWND